MERNEIKSFYVQVLKLDGHGGLLLIWDRNSVWFPVYPFPCLTNFE